MTKTITTTETKTVAMTLTIDDEIQLQPATSGDGEIIPEGRYTLHLIRVEMASPSTFKPEDGPRVKWTFNLYAELVEKLERGELFEFSGKPYEFYRHTSTKNSPRAFARQYSEALLGRKLEDREVPKLGPLVGARMSAMISYDDDPDDSTRKLLKMSGLKHVAPPAAVAAAAAASTAPAAGSDDDRELVVSGLLKSVARLKKMDKTAGAEAQGAVDESDLEEAPLTEIRALWDSVKAAITKAQEDE